MYVDNDPLVLSHAGALLASTVEGCCDYLHADLRDTGYILKEARRTLDFSLPVAVLRFGFRELAAGPPSHWIVTLVGGSQVDVWADAITGLTEKTAHHEHVVFGVLMDIDVDLQDQFEVTARAPAEPVSRRQAASTAAGQPSSTAHRARTIIDGPPGQNAVENPGSLHRARRSSERVDQLAGPPPDHIVERPHALRERGRGQTQQSPWAGSAGPTAEAPRMTNAGSS